jgi:hypothetical protein
LLAASASSCTKAVPMKAATTRRPWANNVLGCFSPASFQRVGRLSHCHLVAAEMALHREGARLLVCGFSATVVAFLHWTGHSLLHCGVNAQMFAP